MKMKRLSAFMALLILVSLAVPTLAIPWYTQEFESLPSPWYPPAQTALEAEGWSFGSGNGETEIRPVSELEVTPTPPGSTKCMRTIDYRPKEVVLSDTTHNSAQERISAWFLVYDYLQSARVNLGFGQVDSNRKYQWYIGNGVDVEIYKPSDVDYPKINIRDGGTDGTWATHFLQAVGGGDYELVRSKWYQIVVDFDVPASTYELGLYDASGVLLASSANRVTGSLLLTTPDPYMDYVNALTVDACYGGTGHNQSFFLDDIAFETIPEPNSCTEALAMGFSIEGDLNSDCYVNLTDIGMLVTLWLDCIDPCEPDCQTPWDWQ